jgi:hypothetical protein
MPPANDGGVGGGGNVGIEDSGRIDGGLEMLGG